MLTMVAVVVVLIFAEVLSFWGLGNKYDSWIWCCIASSASVLDGDFGSGEGDCGNAPADATIAA